MKRFALMVVLCWPAGMIHATFELEDPAAQMEHQQEVMQDRLESQAQEIDTLCMVDTETQKCFCILAEPEQEISITDDECEALASKAANLKKP